VALGDVGHDHGQVRPRSDVRGQGHLVDLTAARPGKVDEVQAA
jgi:hypothetical protein